MMVGHCAFYSFDNTYYVPLSRGVYVCIHDWRAKHGND